MRFRYLTGFAPLLVHACLGSLVEAAPIDAGAFTLRHEVVLNAPVAEVWGAFTTRAGLESWMAPNVAIDLRVGGTMRSVLKKEATLGDESTMESTILSLEPMRMISLKPTRAPGNFPFPEAMKKAWSVVYFEPIDAFRTKLTMIGLGFTGEPESMQMREFYDKGNAMMLERLSERFPKTPSSGNGETALKRLAQLVGGEWISETVQPDGGIFRSRSVIEKGPDGKSLLGRGWLGDAQGMDFHGATQIWLEPGSDELRFQNVGDDGSVARGAITPIGDKQVRWDWNAHSPAGKKTRYRVDMVFEDTDHYLFVLFEMIDDVTPTERVRVKYSRVTETPVGFEKMKAPKP